jgi:hypothetical protein
MASRPYTYVEYNGWLYQLPRHVFEALRASQKGDLLFEPMSVLSDARNAYRIEYKLTDEGLTAQ